MRIAIIFFLSTLVSTISTGQCFPDRHSTSWYDAWVSCETAPNPNMNHGDSHWILYDLSDSYELGEAHFWNINDPQNLDMGISKALIDVSLDGINWYTLDTLYLSQGPGSTIYEGESAFDFDGEVARFVLITAVENFGSKSCYGFSELRVERSQVTTSVADNNTLNTCFVANVYPNPFSYNSLVQVRAECEGDVDWQLTNLLGQVIGAGTIKIDGSGLGSTRIARDDIAPGQYVLNLKQGDAVSNVSLTRLSD